ncbi:hypothetical protein JGU66_06850 [Myxococcaceae bacterium JPH2]|nr:hypothetical protein [Myxococcaceae bacterium JPH2]
MSDFVRELEENARARFVRWHPALWSELLQGPAQALGQALVAAGVGEDEAGHLMRSYLQLGAEGIGLGYLYPASSGRLNVFTLAWSTLVPRLLAAVPSARRADTLAQLWNLGENLEAAPPWVQRVFCRVCRDLPSLDDIEARLRHVAASVLEAPGTPLRQSVQAHWVDLSREDARFLPGAMHFLAPTVVCVHDRHRLAAAGRDAATQGVWLTETPLPLGAMGCKEVPPSTCEPTAALVSLEQRDARAGEWFATGANGWRTVATMQTSQWLAVLIPA